MLGRLVQSYVIKHLVGQIEDHVFSRCLSSTRSASFYESHVPSIKDPLTPGISLNSVWPSIKHHCASRHLRISDQLSSFRTTALACMPREIIPYNVARLAIRDIFILYLTNSSFRDVVNVYPSTWNSICYGNVWPSSANTRHFDNCLSRSFNELEMDREKAATPTLEMTSPCGLLNESGYDGDEDDGYVSLLDSSLGTACTEALGVSHSDRFHGAFCMSQICHGKSSLKDGGGDRGSRLGGNDGCGGDDDGDGDNSDTVRDLVVIVNQILTKVTRIETDLTSIKADIHSLKADVANMKVDISSLKSDVNLLKIDMMEVKREVKDLKELYSYAVSRHLIDASLGTYDDLYGAIVVFRRYLHGKWQTERANRNGKDWFSRKFQLLDENDQQRFETLMRATTAACSEDLLLMSRFKGIDNNVLDRMNPAVKSATYLLSEDDFKIITGKLTYRDYEQVFHERDITKFNNCIESYVLSEDDIADIKKESDRHQFCSFKFIVDNSH